MHHMDSSSVLSRSLNDNSHIKLVRQIIKASSGLLVRRYNGTHNCRRHSSVSGTPQKSENSSSAVESWVSDFDATDLEAMVPNGLPLPRLLCTECDWDRASRLPHVLEQQGIVTGYFPAESTRYKLPAARSAAQLHASIYLDTKLRMCCYSSLLDRLLLLLFATSSLRVTGPLTPSFCTTKVPFSGTTLYIR